MGLPWEQVFAGSNPAARTKLMSDSRYRVYTISPMCGASTTTSLDVTRLYFGAYRARYFSPIARTTNEPIAMNSSDHSDQSRKTATMGATMMITTNSATLTT